MKKDSASSTPGKTKILIAEDSPTQAIQIKHLLESNHYEVSVAQNGRQAMERLSKHKPSLVISDILMPEMNGYELCRKIKSDKNTEDIPVILLTRLSNPEEIIEGLSCGADSFITKPFNEKHLLSNIGKILSAENGNDYQKVPFGVQILFNGEKRTIQAEQQNVIKLMLDIYEGAIYQNEKLVQTQEELGLLNEQLEALVEDRTSDLKEEIKLSNQIAERLKESEEKYRRIFENVQDLYYETSIEGTIIDISPSIEILSKGQYHRDDLIGKSMNDYYSDIDERASLLTQIKERGAVSDFEITLKNKDGSSVPCSISSKIFFDAQGRPEKIIGSVRDITKRKQTEEALQKSQHLFQTLAHVSPVGIFRTNADGNTTYVNPKWAELSGLTFEEAAGFKWLNAVHPDDRENLKKSWQTDYKTRKTSNAEYRFIRSDGSIVWVMGNAEPEWINNQIVGYIGTITDITGLKQGEEELKKNQIQLFNALKLARLGSWEHDVEKNVFIFNDLFYAIFRTTAEQVGGYTMKAADYVNRFIHPEDKDVVAKAIRMINESDQPDYSRQLEHRIIYADGETGYMTIRMIIVKDKKGKTIKTYGVNQDITDRKRAEEALIQSELRFKQLSENFEEWIWEVDKNGLYTYSNQIVKEILGYEPEEIINKKYFYDFFNPEIRELFKVAAFDVFARKESIKNLVNSNLHKDGREVILSTNCLPLLDNTGNLIGYRGVDTNITERIRAEKALVESEERYRMIFENVLDMFFEMSIEGIMLEVSPSVELISKGQYKRDEVAGKPMNDFIYEPAEGEVMMNVIRERGYVSDYELILKNRDGSKIPCAISSKIIFHADGRPEKIIGSIRDITDRKNASDALKFAKERAEASDKLKTTFLNNISHEVRTPLNGIMGFAEIMSETDLTEEEKRISLSMLFESSDRLLNTITNYMDISLITSGNMSLYKKDFLPEQILRELYAKKKIKCLARNLELLLEIPDQTKEITINSDPEILKKILVHLLNNAIKFTEKGSIRYGFTVYKTELEFFIKDTGIGISKESLKSVFEHFVKEDRGPLILSEGSGLGLSISKGLVELLGGKIWVESEKGKGSTFFFTIPVKKEKENLTLSSAKVFKKNNKITSSILVAEDDMANFLYLKTLLKKNTSAEIIHASNGKEAVEKFIQNPDIGLILMDIKMPVMDGLEATRQIKAIKKDIPVIAITAYAMAGDETRILDAGCDYYLTKPVDKKLLFKRMAEIITL
jgi:PAS domain S-box-containing protein